MNEPIRILHITYKMHCAGIEAFIMNMYRNIDRTKVQFDFLVHYSAHQFYDDEIERLGGRIYRLTVREDNNFQKYFKDLKRFFDEHKEYKIVHAHMESFAMFYMPYVKKAGIPVRIAHSHNDKVDPSLKGKIKNIMNKPFKYYATEYMACSKESGQYLFGNRPCWVIQNAIDAQSFIYNEEVRHEVRQELEVEENFVIGHIGRFNTQKNHIFLIDVFSELAKMNDKAVLLCAGEGELQESIEAKVARLGIGDKVKFLGVRKDTTRLYQAMDVFVFPSLYEGLGIVGIEAQAAGLKMVCSDGIPDIARITDGVNALSLQKEPYEWAKKINSFSAGYNRVNTYSEIKNAGFDVKSLANDLQNYYLRRYGEVKERNK